MKTSYDIAVIRSLGSDSPTAFMNAFAAGRRLADDVDGADTFARGLDTADKVAGFIEGLAARRSVTASPRDYLRSTRGTARTGVRS